jgi:linoleoyl-CoA desaturase
VLVVPHINEDAAGADNPAVIKGQNEWALHQIHSTVDSSVNSKVLSWLTGGLNTHLVHHLFPNICHVHYVQLTQIIKQELRNQSIKYNEKTFGASIRDHFRYLKLMGVVPSALLKESTSGRNI